MSSIIVITKLSTTNMGNEALSTELIRLIEGSGTPVEFIGRPPGLLANRLDGIRTQPDPVASFEATAQRIARIVRRVPAPAPRTGKAAVRLLGLQSTRVRIEPVRAAVQKLRRLAWSGLPCSPRYLRRGALYNRAELVAYSGAGEVFDDDIFYRQLMDLRVAQILGCRTVAFNQVVSVYDPVLLQITGHVYGRCERIMVRGEGSVERLGEAGIPADRVEVVPDTAWLTELGAMPEVPELSESDQPTVGVSLNGPHTAPEDAVALVNGLVERGCRVVMLSNDPYADVMIQEPVRHIPGVICLTEAYTYREYATLLTRLDCVVTGRLHTAELALVAGTPVVAIGRMKSREALRAVGYTVPTIEIDPGWPAHVLPLVDQHLAAPEESKAHALEAAAEGARRAVGNLKAIAL